MTIIEREKFYDGKFLWFEYVRLNGYSVKPDRKGLEKLSRKLDQSIKFIESRINFYLEN